MNNILTGPYERLKLNKYELHFDIREVMKSPLVLEQDDPLLIDVRIFIYFYFQFSFEF